MTDQDSFEQSNYRNKKNKIKNLVAFSTSNIDKNDIHRLDQ